MAGPAGRVMYWGRRERKRKESCSTARRSSSLSIICRPSSGAGSGGSRRGSQQPVIEDQRSGSDCEAPTESAQSGVVRIADYVTSRGYSTPPVPVVASAGNGSNRQHRNYEGDDDEDDEEQGGGGGDVSAEDHRNHQRRQHHHHRSGISKPRTSDYESSDSPNSSDHCDDTIGSNSKDDHQQVFARDSDGLGAQDASETEPVDDDAIDSSKDPAPVVVIHQVRSLWWREPAAPLRDSFPPS